MKFTVKAEGFITAISAAIDAATKANLKDFSGGDQIKIEASQDEIIVSSFGGRLAVKTSISDVTFNELNYIFEEKGYVLVNAKDLLSVLTSFSSAEDLVFEVEVLDEGDGSRSVELKISMKSDSEQHQTLPVYDNKMQLPIKADNFAKVIEVKRYILSSGLERVVPASGYEKENHVFLNVAIRAKKNYVRFSAGTGGRHIILEMEGNEVAKATPSDASILIPKDYVPIINKVLSTVTTENVKIQESKKSDTTTFQVCIECGPQEIIIVGLDSALKWVDEQKVVDLNYTTKTIVKVQDLALAANGIRATFNDQIRKAKRIHKVSFDIDMKKKVISVEANEVMRSLRKIEIVDSESQGDKSNFRCMSEYLKEIANYTKDDEFVQIESIDAKKPVVVYGHALNKVANKDDIKKTDSATGITEKMTIFFATTS